MPLLRCELSERTSLPVQESKCNGDQVQPSTSTRNVLLSQRLWGLPSNDTGGVDGARDQRQRLLQNSAQQAGPCTGTTTVANSPFGAYAAENIVKVTFFSTITNLNAVPFTLELLNGEPKDFIGDFDGSKFIPRPGPASGDVPDIQWCPNQNYFQVKVESSPATKTVPFQGSSGSYCDQSWSVRPAPRA